MKAVTYCRVSTDEQKEHGTELKGQAERCRDYAQRLGFEVIAELEDGGISGKIPVAQRPAGAELYRLVYSRTVDAVVFSRSDRLSRDEWGIEGAMFHRACYENSVKIHLCDEGGEVRSDMGGRLMMTLGDRMGGEERKKNAARMQEGRINKVRNGILILSGHISYGYRKRIEFAPDPITNSMRPNSFLEFDELQASNVREIYRLYVVERISLNRIAKHLNQQGILAPRGNKKPRPGRDKHSEWNVSGVHKVIRNTAYIGDFMYAGYCVSRPELAIIDRDTFTKAGELLKMNKRNSPRRTKHEYLLRSRLTCECGKKLVGKTHCKYGKYIYREYRCCYQTKETSERCKSHKVLSCDYFDVAVWEKFIEMLDPTVVKAAARAYVANLTERQKPKRDRLALAIAEHAEAKQLATEYTKLAGKASAKGKEDLVAKYEDDLEKELGRANRLGTEIETVKQELAQSVRYDERTVDSVIADLEQHLTNGMPTFEQKRKLVEWANLQGQLDGERVKFRMEIGLTFDVPRSKSAAGSFVSHSTERNPGAENRPCWCPSVGYRDSAPDRNPRP